MRLISIQRGVALVLAGLVSLSLLGRAADEPDVKWLERSRQADLSPEVQRAYEEIAKLKICHITLFRRPGGMDLLWIETGDGGKPAKAICDLGIEALPALVDALGDATVSSVVEPHRRPDGPDRTWKVGELVAGVIWQMTYHHFVIGEEPNEKRLNPHAAADWELVPQFQKLIMEWYQANRGRTIEERNIADLEDHVLQNRVSAVEWLAEHRSVAAKPAISRYIDWLLTRKIESSSSDYEMAAAAAALASIGGQDGLPAVRKVCQKLGEYHRSMPETMNHFDTPRRLFKAFGALARLGEKETALREFTELYAMCRKSMDKDQHDEFEKLVSEARNW